MDDEKKSDEVTRKKLLDRFKAVEKVVSPIIDQDFISSISIKSEKNPNNFSYKDGRYLDAWARLLDIQKPCSAVSSFRDKLYISFNTTEKIQHQKIKIISFAIEDCITNKEPLSMLCAILLFNVKSSHNNKDYQALIGKAFKIPNIKEWNDFYKTNGMIIVELVQKNSKEIYEDIKRDVDNLYKNDLLSCQVKIINNKEKLHAEIAVATYLKSEILEKKEDVDLSYKSPIYIGISKLSCYICDKILHSWKVDHRGTHGKLYMNNYVFPKESSNEFIQNIIDEINKYLRLNWEDVGNRVFNYDRIYYENRESENATCSEDECWQEEPSLSGESSALFSIES